METSQMVQVFKHIIENPIARAELKALLQKENGVPRIYKYLKAIAEGKSVKNIHFVVLKSILNTGLHAFVGEEHTEDLRSALSDPYFRRGLASVVRGLYYFGVRKPFVPGAPFLIVWDVTYACNLRCKHCYANAGRALRDELTTEEALRAIDVFGDAGIVALAFSGGEPLVRRDLFRLSDRAKEYEMHVSIATNGTLLTKEKVNELKKHRVDFVQISLDGTKETHEKFRGIPSIYDRTIQGIKNCVEAGIVTCIAMTATRMNYKEVPAVMDLAEKLGVDFMLYNFVPTGRGAASLDLTAEEREELLNMLWSRLESGSKVTFLSTAPYYARVALQHGKSYLTTHFYNAKLEGQAASLADFIGGCGAGRMYLGMKPDGNIQPCVFMPLTLASIRDFSDGDEFLEFWRGNKVLTDLRNKDVLSICGNCPYRYVCGGCRARAYAYFREYMAPDPGCIIAARALEVQPKQE